MPQNSPFIDFQSDIEITCKSNLPHWHQKEKIQFVTFRQADSLPQDQINALKEEIATFKALNPEPWTPEVRQRYRKQISRKEEQLLDEGLGSCKLRKPEIRKIIHDAFFHKADIDYRLLAYVIMPNHVHMLIQPIGSKKLSQILHVIKGYTANQINKATNSNGKVWLAESFDRIVRDTEHLKHCVSYISENPRFLHTADYELYINRSLISTLLINQ